MVPSPEDQILEIIAQAEQQESRSFLRSCLLAAIGIIAFVAFVVWLSCR